MRVQLRPTIAADLAEVIDIPLPHRIRAVTAELDGRVLGVGGIGFRPDGTVFAFMAANDAFRNYPAAVHRAGIAGMRLIRECGAPVVFAEAQPGNPAAERWLLHFGFCESTVDGRRLFIWERDADAA